MECLKLIKFVVLYYRRYNDLLQKKIYPLNYMKEAFEATFFEKMG